jgi:hypothetical protein
MMVDSGQTISQGRGRDDPRGEYARRLEASRGLAARLARRDDLAGNARLGVFLLGVVLAILCWRGVVGVAWPVATLVLFAALVVVHGRIIASRRKAEGKAAYHERGLARLDDRWAGQGATGARFLDEEHPYAADLDLFGVGSLFERLCTARTSSGESTLAAWLLRPASLAEIAGRQRAVEELRANLDFREDLALLGDDVRSGVAPESLAAWGLSPQRRAPLWARGLIALVALATLIAAIGWLAQTWGTLPFLGLIAVEVAIASWYARRASRALADVEARSGELETLAGLLARIEREPFESPRLRELKSAIESGGRPASIRIARLAGLVRWLEARHNVYFALFSSMLLWKTQLGLAIETWREAEGASIGRWLEVVGEVEAFSSLASFAFENPSDPFPEVVGPERGPILEGEGLGHPLLPLAHCVRNDIGLGGDLRVLSVSGSNMSGKSTWLRTVGINAVLAQAGATVRARC